MSGGNPFAGEMLASAFHGGGYGAQFGNSSDQEDAYYNFLLEIAKRKEARDYAEQQASSLADQLGPAFGQSGDQGEGSAGWLDRQDLSPDLRNAMEMAANLVRSRNPVAMDAALQSYNSLQNALSTDKPADVKIYEAIQRDPNMMDIMMRYKKASVAPTVQIGPGGEYQPQMPGQITGISPLTPDQNQALGLPPSKKMYQDNRGQLHEVPGLQQTEVRQLSTLDTFKATEDDLDALQQAYPDFNPSDTFDGVVRAFSSNDANPLSSIVGMFQSEQSKQYANIAKRWVTSDLNFLSGSEVPEREVGRGIKMYFAQPNDSSAVLEQKKLARMQHAQALMNASGLSPEEKAKVWRGDLDRQTRIVNEMRKTATPTAPIESVSRKVSDYAQFLKEKGMTHTPALQQKFNEMWDMRYGGR